MKYRKKPIVIEAIQFTGLASVGEVMDFCPTFDAEDSSSSVINFIIPTLEGNMRVSIDDWIIKGIHGEFYPCKPDIFEASYEPA